jgi:hypothetical protein
MTMHLATVYTSREGVAMPIRSRTGSRGTSSFYGRSM